MAASLAGKVFVITGSASGMGYATATTLIARGALLGLCDTNADGLSKIVNMLDEDHKSRVLTCQVNITDRAAVREFLRTTKEKFGKIDGVANLAGTAGHKMGHFEIWDVEDQEYDFIMNVNAKGPFIVISEALKPGLMEEPGSIVHITSMFGERGFRKGAIYSTSKHAGIGLVKSAAMEAARRRIRVNSVMP
jgi:NAD(P)-dependent dehydrogenase (short-subunit alcohol dehydrogenase family)